MYNYRGTTPKRRHEIAARLKEAHAQSKYKDLTQKEIATKLRLKSQQSVSLWFRGERLPGAENLLGLAELFNISLDWLLLGKGDMRGGTIKGKIIYIESWPKSAQETVKDMAAMYDHG